MLVQTYECEETSTETVECSDEAKRLIESLGLEGQQKLIAPPECPAGSVRIPYRQMTKQEYIVFKAICPIESEAKKYEASPMPVRVLQVLAHATALDFFDHILVWSQDDATVKDPVLVGVKTEGYDRKYYILARWGEALDEMPALVKAATAICRQKLVARLEEIKEEVNAWLTTARNTSDLQALAHMPSFYR